MIVTNDYKFSSNVNEVIGAVLNFFFFFFFTKRFDTDQNHKTA